MSGQDIERMSIPQLAAGFRAGSLTPNDVANWCLERHERFGQPLNAYKTWCGEALSSQSALATAAFQQGLDLGGLQGIPFSAKDMLGVPGVPTFAGSPRRLPPKWEQAGPVVQALQRQLAPFSGKTHTVEFAFGGLGTNRHWGMPRNPWDASAHRAPGGSSSGAGVSLHEGSALVALGTDTAGSIRIPASMTGVVGLKLTKGRWDAAGMVPLCASFDTPGLLTRTVEDAVWAYRSIETAMGRAAGELPSLSVADLRIGIGGEHFWDGCSPGVTERVREALQELAQAGARLRDHDIAGADEAYALFNSEGGLTPHELYAFLQQELPDWVEDLDPRVGNRVLLAHDYPAWKYVQRKQQFAAMGQAAAASLSALDVVIVPTIPNTPPRLAEIEETTAYQKQNILSLRNTCVANLMGLCALTMPVGLDAEGMPVGMMLLAEPWQEARLLAAALAIESCLGSGRERLGVPALTVGEALATG